MLKYHLLPLVFTIGLLSCESGVEIENISTEELYAVSSWISPQDTLLELYLFKASPLGTVAREDSAEVRDALVLISDGNNNIDTLHFDPDFKPEYGRQGMHGRYAAKPKNIHIEPLTSYFLKVETRSGILLEANCTIPSTPPLPEVSGSRVEDDYAFTVSIESTSKERYFSLITYAEGIVESETSNPERPVYKSQLHSRLLTNVKFPADILSAAKQHDGIIPQAYNAENPKAFVSLRFIEENLYRYLQDFQFYDHWQSNNSGALFPNFQEPQPIHSNIKGGVGIFAGHNQSTVEIEL